MKHRIRQARRDLGLTQVELAAKLSVTTRSVQGWEAGTAAPHARTLRALAELSGRPVAWFYEEAVAEEAAA